MIHFYRSQVWSLSTFLINQIINVVETWMMRLWLMRMITQYYMKLKLVEILKLKFCQDREMWYDLRIYFGENIQTLGPLCCWQFLLGRPISTKYFDLSISHFLPINYPPLIDLPLSLDIPLVSDLTDNGVFAQNNFTKIFVNFWTARMHSVTQILDPLLLGDYCTDGNKGWWRFRRNMGWFWFFTSYFSQCQNLSHV